ncbi:MAG: SWIM zinc finger family protein [Merismopediaceae bacterium]|nr:SWIM zinc finger family protein [Merismopediaceae bacterium]
MEKIKLKLADLRKEATESSWTRGEDYYQGGAVRQLIQRGQSLEALVNGSDYEPYFVQIALGDKSVEEADCNCPYDYGGWCKHIVATLLTYLDHNEDLEQRLPLTDLLAQLDAKQLKEVLAHLVQEKPQLTTTIEKYLHKNYQIYATQTVDAKSSPASQVTVNTNYYKSQVKTIFSGFSRDYEYEEWYDDEGTEVYDDLRELFGEVEDLIGQKDYVNAIAVLTVITEGILSNWHKIEDYGYELRNLSPEIDSYWTQLVLMAPLSSQEKSKLQEDLAGWDDQGMSLKTSLMALQQGWDYPPLVLLFGGDETVELWPLGRPDGADKLAKIRLEVLDSQKRYEEYLLLAKAEGLVTEYLGKLVWLDRIETALQEAQALLTTSDQALALSKALQDQGATAEAIQVAQSGFSRSDRPSQTYDLATWLLELAKEVNDPDLILISRLKRFQSKPKLSEYFKIQDCAGDDWEFLKEDLLNSLQEQDHWINREEKINIFLHEARLDAAIAEANHLSSYNQETLMKVMEAVVNHNPQWVIDKARPPAESIMNAGKASKYDEAIQWLSYVKKAYLAAGQSTVWQTYFSSLKSLHQSKRKLMGLFKTL